jgi:hypothetical protein
VRVLIRYAASPANAWLPAPQWLGPPWHWPAPSTVRFSPDLRTAAELVGARSAAEEPGGESRAAA